MGSLLEMCDDGWSIPRPQLCYFFELQLKIEISQQQSITTRERERERERERDGMEWNSIQFNWIVAQEGKTIKSCHGVADLSPSIVAQEEFNHHVVVECKFEACQLIHWFVCLMHEWIIVSGMCGIQNKFGLSSLFAC